jgi:hypothetical protein
MAGKFRLRHLMNRIPVLDRLRISFIANFFTYGIGSLDRNYDVIKVYPESIRSYVQGQKPAVFALYHGRMVGFLQLIKVRKKMRLLISQSRDGEIIARALTNLGFLVARGSSGRGAVQGTKQLLRSARAGESMVIMVDGPRGPIHDVKLGSIRLAEMTGLPIIPCVCSARHYTEMWGWDKFMCSHWGGPKNYVYGEPIFVPRGLDDAGREQYRHRLSEAMTKLRTAADSYWAAIA